MIAKKARNCKKTLRQKLEESDYARMILSYNQGAVTDKAIATMRAHRERMKQLKGKK